MATDAISLNAQGLMYGAQTAPQWQLMKLSLLSQILLVLNPVAAVDPTTLLNNAQQYNGYGPQCWQLMELALLAQLVASAAGLAANGSVTHGTGNPVAAPGVAPSLYVDDSTGNIWIYFNARWHNTGVSTGP